MEALAMAARGRACGKRDALGALLQLKAMDLRRSRFIKPLPFDRQLPGSPGSFLRLDFLSLLL